MTYRTIRLPKSDGSVRIISAPSPSLARAQASILARLRRLYAPTEPCHGFVEGRSILTNARPHVGRLVVVRVDLAGFFHSVKINRVAGIFRSLGIDASTAREWAIVCTQSIKGKGRVLPQGACTSPMIANLACRGLDASITALVSERGYSFTRYADDITISGDDVAHWPELLGRIESAVTSHGFKVNRSKVKVMLAHCQQSTAGIVLNQRMNLSRALRREIRAELHQSQEVSSRLEGLLSHLRKVREG